MVNSLVEKYSNEIAPAMNKSLITIQLWKFLKLIKSF